jgi:hypothetical protein
MSLKRLVKCLQHHGEHNVEETVIYVFLSGQDAMMMNFKECFFDTNKIRHRNRIKFNLTLCHPYFLSWWYKRASSSETLVPAYDTTWFCITKDRKLRRSFKQMQHENGYSRVNPASGVQGLRLHEHWDRGFESSSGRKCLSLFVCVAGACFVMTRFSRKEPK